MLVVRKIEEFLPSASLQLVDKEAQQTSNYNEVIWSYILNILLILVESEQVFLKPEQC